MDASRSGQDRSGSGFSAYQRVGRIACLYARARCVEVYTDSLTVLMGGCGSDTSVQADE